MTNSLLNAFEPFKDFSRIFLDAYVLIKANEEVILFNQPFTHILDLPSSKIKDNEFYSLFNIDEKNKIFLDSLITNRKASRIDEITISTKTSCLSKVLIVSSYPFFDKNKNFLGTCLLIRDVSAETYLLDKYSSKSVESITDSLTGLYTRRFLSKKIKEFLKSKGPFGIILIDLDFFKKVNDTYGHQAGDHVLKETAHLLKTISRKDDIIARYGGEEFVLLINQASQSSLLKICEKIRLSIAQHKYKYEDKQIPVTTSLGASLSTNDLQETEDLLIKQADRALYEAKKRGRNQGLLWLSHDNFINTKEDKAPSL